MAFGDGFDDIHEDTNLYTTYTHNAVSIARPPSPCFLDPLTKSDAAAGRVSRKASAAGSLGLNEIKGEIEDLDLARTAKGNQKVLKLGTFFPN